MFKRRYVTLLPLFVLLAACSSKPKPTETETTTGTPSGGFLLEPQHNVMQMGRVAGVWSTAGNYRRDYRR